MHIYSIFGFSIKQFVCMYLTVWFPNVNIFVACVFALGPIVADVSNVGLLDAYVSTLGLIVAVASIVGLLVAGISAE